MQSKNDGIDQMIDLLDSVSNQIVGDEDTYDPYKDQPAHFSWLTVFCSSGNVATESTVGISYKDAQEFQKVVVETVQSFFNPITLQNVIDKKIMTFGMQIGPEQHSGTNLNDELGIEVDYE